MGGSGKACIAGVMIICLGSVAEAQPPIRIGASLSKTGRYAAEAQHALRGYQLCIKHTNATGGVLGRKLELVTVFGPFRVDGGGLQVAHTRVMFQWQDGKKVIVWPEELAPGKPRFPTPPWSQRP
jgi:hypothetical protein